jgi:hypothetical protein
MKPPMDPSNASESTLEWWRSPGVVYFIAAGSPPVAIKIGMAAQTKSNTLKSTISRRLSQIQSSNHELVELLGVIYLAEGEYPTREAEILERELHLEFEHLQRFAKNTRGAEWFTASPELVSKVQSIATSPEELGLPKHFSILASSGENA